jgi:hypothetical protein
MKDPIEHRGTPAEHFDRPLIEWLVFDASRSTFCDVPPGEPTPEEIRARAAEVRAGWSPLQLRRAEGEFVRPPAVVHQFSESIFAGRKTQA